MGNTLTELLRWDQEAAVASPAQPPEAGRWYDTGPDLTTRDNFRGDAARLHGRMFAVASNCQRDAGFPLTEAMENFLLK